jgi:hypothetical protein
VLEQQAEQRWKREEAEVRELQETLRTLQPQRFRPAELLTMLQQAAALTGSYPKEKGTTWERIRQKLESEALRRMGA